MQGAANRTAQNVAAFARHPKMPAKPNTVATRALADLQTGEGGCILETPIHNERLAEIGLVKGEEVRVTQVAPFGDPVVLSILDAPVVVRRDDLVGIFVQ